MDLVVQLPMVVSGCNFVTEELHEQSPQQQPPHYNSEFPKCNFIFNLSRQPPPYNKQFCAFPKSAVVEIALLWFNSITSNGLFSHNSLYWSISDSRVSNLFSLLLCLIKNSVLNSESVDLDQMSHSAVSDLGLHCWSVTLWVSPN